MANGIVYGRVNAVKENSIMLDDGQWYGDRDMVTLLGAEGIGLKDYVILSYWTKSVNNDGTWRNYKNVVALRKVENCAFKQLGDYFSRGVAAKLPEEGQHPRTEAADQPAPF
jgi:hypothetical protein